MKGRRFSLLRLVGWLDVLLGLELAAHAVHESRYSGEWIWFALAVSAAFAAMGIGTLAAAWHPWPRRTWALFAGLATVVHALSAFMGLFGGHDCATSLHGLLFLLMTIVYVASVSPRPSPPPALD